MARILVVDDHPIDRQLLLQLLGYKGHDVWEAADGVEALRMIRERRPDLVISDVQMPGMDGLSLVRTMQADLSIADIPIIFYTAAYHDDEAIALAQRSKVAFVLNKPSQPQAILDTVTQALSSVEVVRLGDRSEQHEHERNAVAMRLSALVRVGLDLSALERDAAAMQQKFCHSARHILQADFAFVSLIPSQAATEQLFCSGVLTDAHAAMDQALAIDKVFRDRVIAQNRVVRLSLLAADLPADCLHATCPMVSCLMGVPILLRNEVYGWLCLVRHSGRVPFDGEDERIAVTLAAQGARSIENALVNATTESERAGLEHEISDRRDAEEQLLQALLDANARLQTSLELAERTRIDLEARERELSDALAERDRSNQLLEARNVELTGLDRLKDEFIGIISHELRTPLNAMLGFGSCLADGVGGALRPQQQGFADKIVVGAERLMGLLQDLLDISQIRAGKLSLDRKLMRLDHAITTCMELLEARATTRQIALTVEMPQTPLEVKGDRQRVEQVLINLIGNALKFTPNGSRVRVRAFEVGDRVRVEVEDEGPGILPEDIKRLFQPFGQLDSSVTRPAIGVGLGLAIVKNLVLAHGGEVGIESRQLPGACVWFNLPKPSEGDLLPTNQGPAS